MLPLIKEEDLLNITERIIKRKYDYFNLYFIDIYSQEDIVERMNKLLKLGRVFRLYPLKNNDRVAIHCNKYISKYNKVSIIYDIRNKRVKQGFKFNKNINIKVIVDNEIT